jgi:hypothetical protein
MQVPKAKKPNSYNLDVVIVNVHVDDCVLNLEC